MKCTGGQELTSECEQQVIIGSYPHGDGTFDKANDFQSVVVDGAWSMALATAKLHAGQVAYIVPAAKGAPASPRIIYMQLSYMRLRIVLPCLQEMGSWGMPLSPQCKS